MVMWLLCRPPELNSIRDRNRWDENGVRDKADLTPANVQAIGRCIHLLHSFGC